MIKDMLRPISYRIKLVRLKKKWSKKNSHNMILPGSLFDINKVTAGKFSYGTIDVHTFGNTNEQLEIGNYCSIANGCSFILSGEHNYKSFSTFPMKFYFDKECKSDCLCKGKIKIGDDVWIGYRSIILSGVTVGQGAVIGAGSIVSHDIPPYAIAVGNPATVIKYRFSDEIINKLLKVDFSKLKIDCNRLNTICSDITESNIDQIIKILED